MQHECHHGAPDNPRANPARRCSWVVVLVTALAAPGVVPGRAAVAQGVASPPGGIHQALGDALDQMARQLARTIEDENFSRVGVLEFVSETGMGERLGADFGLLGRWCAEELQKRLGDLGRVRFTVIDRREFQHALQAERFSVRDLGSVAAMQRLSKAVKGLPVLAQGTLRSRSGRLVLLDCKLVRTDTAETVGSAGEAANLNESQWGMLGRSVVVAPAAAASGPPTVAQLDQIAQGPHPMTNPAFPFPVRILVGGHERKGVAHGNDWYVGVREGEVYEIRVENRSGRPVCMRLLVDGLNTLPEPMPVRGILTEYWAQRVSLDRARHFVLDPAVSRVFGVRGFVTETGKEGKVRVFTVSHAEKALAARQQFTDQVGLITAAFYEVRAVSRNAPTVESRGIAGVRGLGTTAGPTDSPEDLTERADSGVGNLLAVVHIRYVDADELRKLSTARP